MFIPRQKSYISASEILQAVLSSDQNLLNLLKIYAGHDGVTLFPSARTAIEEALRFYNVKEIVMPEHTYGGYAAILKGLKKTYLPIDNTLNTPVQSFKEVNPNIAALIPHHYGNVYPVSKLSNRFIIEDATQAFGGVYDGQHTGTMGNIGLISFSRGKYQDLMGGCAVISKDSKFLEHLRQKECKKISTLELSHLLLTYIYLLFSSGKIGGTLTTWPFLLLQKDDPVPNLIEQMFTKITKGKHMHPFQLQLGTIRWKKIPKHIRNQQERAKLYRRSLQSIPQITLPPAQESVYLYFPILVDNPKLLKRKLLIKGIDSKIDFHFSYRKNNYANRILHIPVSVNYTEQKQIIRALHEIYRI
ncbi:DegT/DnrJ/EryC1/StrS family aminotransferase [Candidatus Woesearchaeota archaeon]|nr:DegT/DnrJ/EryC1/StrS family aminotransferase [Candidatus Woesearchaeota archaeon]